MVAAHFSCHWTVSLGHCTPKTVFCFLESQKLLDLESLIWFFFYYLGFSYVVIIPIIWNWYTYLILIYIQVSCLIRTSIFNVAQPRLRLRLNVDLILWNAKVYFKVMTSTVVSKHYWSKVNSIEMSDFWKSESESAISFHFTFINLRENESAQKSPFLRL